MNLLYQRADCRISGGGLKLGLGLVGADRGHLTPSAPTSPSWNGPNPDLCSCQNYPNSVSLSLPV